MWVWEGIESSGGFQICQNGFKMVFTFHGTPRVPVCLNSQVSHGCVEGLALSHFQDLSATFLTSPVVCGSPHLQSQPEARNATGSPLTAGTEFAFHS